jgi:hypothetical protein
MIGTRKTMGVLAIALSAIAAWSTFAGAQVLTGEQVQKIAPSTYYFSGQSAAVQARNTAGLKNSGGKVVLAGLVDNSGYSTAIQQKYQGFLIAETKINFDGGTLDPGEYGFGFKDGKFVVMNVAAADVVSVASQNDSALKHPVPLKIEQEGGSYRLYSGRQYVVLSVD